LTIKLRRNFSFHYKNENPEVVKPIPAPIHTEKSFEEAIESQLLEKGGYIKGNPDDYRELALDTKTIFAFLQKAARSMGNNRLQYMRRYRIQTFAAPGERLDTGDPGCFEKWLSLIMAFAIKWHISNLQAG